MNIRIGNGYDTHPLIEGKKLILGGIHVPSAKGVHGHSDGDVLTHAIIDSLLGALGHGDIGRLFPPTSDNYNISSIILLQKVMDILSEKKYKILNIDTTIILESPKISELTIEMRKLLSKHMKVCLLYTSDAADE